MIAISRKDFDSLPPEVGVDENRPTELRKLVQPGVMLISHAGVNQMVQCTFSKTTPRGYYFLALLAGTRRVIIYSCENWEFRTPVTASKGEITAISFNPAHGGRFITATQHHIIITDLLEKRKLLQLRPRAQWISSISVHPRGDHILAGSYDGRAFWFDSDLQAEPFKVLRHHQGAVRDVAYHSLFPLFATAGSDAVINVFHGQVFADLVTNPLIVGVKELRGHEPNGTLGVISLKWHPKMPWLLSGGGDHSVRLWC